MTFKHTIWKSCEKIYNHYMVFKKFYQSRKNIFLNLENLGLCYKDKQLFTCKIFFNNTTHITKSIKLYQNNVLLHLNKDPCAAVKWNRAWKVNWEKSILNSKCRLSKYYIMCIINRTDELTKWVLRTCPSNQDRFENNRKLDNSFELVSPYMYRRFIWTSLSHVSVSMRRN